MFSQPPSPPHHFPPYACLHHRPPGCLPRPQLRRRRTVLSFSLIRMHFSLLHFAWKCCLFHKFFQHFLCIIPRVHHFALLSFCSISYNILHVFLCQSYLSHSIFLSELSLFMSVMPPTHVTTTEHIYPSYFFFLR